MGKRRDRKQKRIVMKSLVVSNLKIGIDDDETTLLHKLQKEGVSCDFDNIRVLKKSLDARDKSDIKFVYNIAVEGDFRASSRLGHKCSYKDLETYKMPKSGFVEASNRHVVIGSGPSGLFAALILAKAGLNPLVIERGEPVDDRLKSVDAFWNNNKLNADSNVCYGEGGAGTFSDGKLNTGIKDSSGRMKFILDEFVKAGADESIKYWYKPHIGSDVLVYVVKNIREQIISLGGEFLFNTRLNNISSDLTLTIFNTKTKENSFVKAEDVIIATGHSALDIYKMLEGIGAEMKSKPFAVGVRVQHTQEMINKSQFGDCESPNLPVADYKCTAKSSTGRGVYTFCMCPGGKVVNSSTTQGELCINGMSYAARDGRNANSAVIVTVGPEDFGEDVFDGIKYQKNLEKLAYCECDGSIPTQRFEDYMKCKKSSSFGSIIPDFCGSYDFGNIYNIFNEDINKSICDGINDFGRHIEGFNGSDVILSGVESRTSSPIKIYRDERFESNIKGVFPCGEGAGYAGGIMSAAVDGMRVAEEIVRRYKS